MDFKERLAKSQAQMDQLKAKLNDAAETAQINYLLKKDEIEASLSKLGAQIDDSIATLEGNAAAAQENARLNNERGRGKLNAALLKAQMSVNAAKENITAKKEALDQAKQEKRISSLLDYADNCQELALAAYLDSQLSLLQAAEEIADYLEKYGE